MMTITKQYTRDAPSGINFKLSLIRGTTYRGGFQNGCFINLKSDLWLTLQEVISHNFQAAWASAAVPFSDFNNQ